MRVSNVLRALSWEVPLVLPDPVGTEPLSSASPEPLFSQGFAAS